MFKDSAAWFGVKLIRDAAEGVVNRCISVARITALLLNQ